MVQEKKIEPKMSQKLAFIDMTKQMNIDNPWTDVDSMKAYTLSTSIEGIKKDYRDVIKACRFFYRHDAMASSVVNKIVEIGFPGIRVGRGSIPENQFKIFEIIADDIEDFVEECALEYLLSGLVIPEVDYQPITKETLKEFGIKKFTSMKVPSQMWLVNPDTVIIKAPPIGSIENYYIELDQETLSFLTSGGKLSGGDFDRELYEQFVKAYPEFVKAINSSKDKLGSVNIGLIKLDSPYVIKRRQLSDSPYPIPFLSPVLESLKHKRNLRRMDYSLASRAIMAILQWKIGSDEFPLLEGEEGVIDDLKTQLYARNTTANSNQVERIFQFFTNHTVEGTWIVPPLEALVNTEKYDEINLDILQALGFPRILLTGEVQRTGTTDADIALLSPIKALEFIRRKLLRIVKKIFNEVASLNDLPVPTVSFEPINLIGFKDYIAGLQTAYKDGVISAEDSIKPLGLDFEDTITKRKEEEKKFGIGVTETQNTDPKAKKK